MRKEAIQAVADELEALPETEWKKPAPDLALLLTAPPAVAAA
jgi:hypothetical protein